ncbi:MAG: hypothetical protein Q8R96_22915 [Bacteroidota bacterium]|nr:hypothetical protein [Bacteroidota bacterium]
MLGGKIWVEKDPELLVTRNKRDGTGTTICFTIPYHT